MSVYAHRSSYGNRRDGKTERKKKTPSFMEFDVISTQQENVLEFVKELRSLMKENNLVVVSEHKI